MCPTLQSTVVIVKILNIWEYMLWSISMLLSVWTFFTFLFFSIYLERVYVLYLCFISFLQTFSSYVHNVTLDCWNVLLLPHSLLCCILAQNGEPFSFKKCAISIALAVGLITGVPTFGLPTYAQVANPVLSDLSVLISGPPIKDPGALLRYALPIDNKAIREVQKPLEDITESLKIAGVKALDSVERVRHKI